MNDEGLSYMRYPLLKCNFDSKQSNESILIHFISNKRYKIVLILGGRDVHPLLCFNLS